MMIEKIGTPAMLEQMAEEAAELAQAALKLARVLSSVEIMRSILSYFSGWLDENDCDKEEAYFIEEQPDGVTPNTYGDVYLWLHARLYPDFCRDG